MQDLRAVLDWYPEFAEAYDLMATARKVGGGTVAAMQAERAAIQLSPRNQEYVLPPGGNLHRGQEVGGRANPVGTFEDERQSAGCGGKRASSDEAGQRAEIRTLDGIELGSEISPQSSPFDVLSRMPPNARRTAQTSQTAGVGDRRAAKFSKAGWWAWTARSPRPPFLR